MQITLSSILLFCQYQPVSKCAYHCGDDSGFDEIHETLGANIDAPYSCQGGVCSSCIARVTEGKAEMVKNQILTDGEIEEGFILTCQAHATTATLKVDYDDVQALLLISIR